MKLRKTLAGILGAVVMLLGVGTFEHVNRETGVHAATVWQLVKDASTLKAGDVVVITENSKGFVASNTISSSVMENLSATFSSDKETITSLPSGAAQLTLGGSSGSWTLTNTSDKELGATAVKKVAWGSGTTTWSITVDANGDATIQNTTSSYGRFLYNASSPRFTTYTSDTNVSMLLPELYVAIEVNVAVPLGKPMLSLDKYTGKVSWKKIDNAVKYQYTINDGTPIETTETSVVLTDGQSIKVEAIGDGINYLNSGYSDPETYEKIQVTSTIQSWISTYSTDGVYTKKSQIYLNYNAANEIIEYFHQDDNLVHQNRTTYYNKDTLFMSNLDGSIGGENGINSGYRTNGTNLEHFVLNSNNEAIKDWEVKNTTLKEFFVTLDTFNQDNYFDSWKVISEKEAVFTPVGESLILDNNCDSVQDMLAFAAPCLENTILSTNYIKLSKLSISKETNSTYGDYLSFKIYVSEGDIKKVTDKNLILSEARVYADNKVFDELATNELNVTKTGNGQVTYSPNKEHYRDNEVVTITATPDEGYYISQILINGIEKTIENESGETFTVSIKNQTNANKVNVVFAEIPQAGETIYSYTFTKNQYSESDGNVTKTLGEVSWAFNGTQSNGNYKGWDSNKGQQYGSSKKPYTSAALSTTYFSSENVKRIAVTTSGASSINCTLVVTIGGQQIGDAVKLTATSTEYTFENKNGYQGEVKLTYTNSSSKAIYIKTITVVY